MAYVNSALFVIESINAFDYYRKYLDDDFVNNYRMCQCVCDSIIESSKVDFEVEGEEYVSSKEPFLVCSNHFAFFDIAALCHAINKPMPFAAAKELTYNPIISKYIKSINSVLINRNTDDLKLMKKQLEYMETAIRETGLILFPEGECSYGKGDIKEFKKGGFIAAKKHDTLIVPTYIDYKDYKRFGRLIVPKDRVVVKFDKPFRASDIADKKMNAQSLANYTRDRVLTLKKGETNV